LFAVVATEWLLWESEAGGFDDGTWPKFAGLDAHEQAVAAAEAKDVCETHYEGEGVLVEESKFQSVGSCEEAGVGCGHQCTRYSGHLCVLTDVRCRSGEDCEAVKSVPSSVNEYQDAHPLPVGCASGS
jgi:hypothetical protein